MSAENDNLDREHELELARVYVGQVDSHLRIAFGSLEAAMVLVHDRWTTERRNKEARAFVERELARRTHPFERHVQDTARRNDMTPDFVRELFQKGVEKKLREELPELVRSALEYARQPNDEHEQRLRSLLAPETLRKEPEPEPDPTWGPRWLGWARREPGEAVELDWRNATKGTALAEREDGWTISVHSDLPGARTYVVQNQSGTPLAYADRLVDAIDLADNHPYVTRNAASKKS